MAITQNNVENVKFLRNQNPFESREAARTALENNKGVAADGTALLARYTTSGEVKTIVGFVYVTGETHNITIFDTEGASGDVEALRREINAKLGTTFIGPDNTVEANLTALSGNNSSTSAETSVEGAKRYADELKNQMDYTGVTTGDGVYVTNVTQSDGIVSATTATLPTVTGEVESKKVVMSVSEDKGEIAVTKGTIESSDKTVVIGDLTEGNGIDFKVNIDNDTLVADKSTGVISVASAALTQYVGDEDTIHISAADAQNNKTVSSLLTIKEVSTGVPDTVAHRYMLAGTGTTKIGEYIDIPKDSALVNFYLGHVDDLLEGTTAQTEESTTSTVVPGSGDTALVWIMQLANGKYKLTAVDVHSFIDEAEFASGVTWDSTDKKVKGVVDSTSEKDSQDTPVDFLTVGENGFKISGIKDEIYRKINALDATGGTQTIATDKHVAVEVVEANGLITAVTVTEDNIADADDLAELSGKTITAITSTNGSITASISNEDGNKTADIQTDADKIQMSGFSAGNTTALSGIAESDSIATAFEKTNTVITENERVTAAALTGLDGRLDVVEAEYISGVSVNGNAVTITDKIAALTLNSAPSTGAAETPIIVETSNNGGITLKFDGLDCGYYA